MVEYSHPLDAVFHALADPTRRAMLARLAEHEHTVGDLAMPFKMSFAGASKHIRVLEQAGLVQREIRGRTHVCRLDPGPLASAHDWLAFYTRFWATRLDALEQLLRASPSDCPIAKQSADAHAETSAETKPDPPLGTPPAPLPT